MYTINNSTNNHYSEIIKLADSADTLYIVSPYLMESFESFFNDLPASVKTIHLVTMLKNYDIDLLRKANALDSFCCCCKEKGLNYKIYEDKILHGKIYIASQQGKCMAGIITSANFTESGLNRKHEWGLRIDDSAMLEETKREIFSCCEGPLTQNGIDGILQKVNTYFETTAEPDHPVINLNIDEFINNHKGTNPEVADRAYFIKPVGWTKEPFEESNKMAGEVETLLFSRRKPRAINIGDIIICYAVGSTKLLGYFEVLELPEHSGIEDDRWPWAVKAENLCSEYSENWAAFDNTLSKVTRAYKANDVITYVGGTNLGALNYGADKIRITDDFAEHIIDIMNGSVADQVPAIDTSLFSSLELEIAGILARLCLSQSQPLITYKELARQLSVPMNPKNLGIPLGNVSTTLRQLGMPLLSVIVVSTDTNFPGSGFFTDFFPQSKEEDRIAIFIEQYKLVTSYDKWDRLANLT